MIGFGALDLFSFYKNAPHLVRTIESYTPSITTALLVLLIVSLLVSGPLTMVGNRIGMVVYYFQFPLRLAFLTALTFGFILKLFPTQTGTFTHGMVLATVIGLEAVRLMLTIQKNKGRV